MEDFFEANKVVEVSLSKLTSKGGDLPLRKTLLISKVLSRAQDTATSAEMSLLSSPHRNSDRCKSKLLASFGQTQSNMDGLPVSPLRLSRPKRQQNPIATESHELQSLREDESMDFDSVSSVLGDILQEVDSDDDDRIGDIPSVCEDLCHPTINRPVSPGKRNYQQAFSFDSDIVATHSSEDLKRFKCSSPESSPLESLPDFCGYLSSKNLQTAPFITYMFGRGFSHPTNPDSTGGWPEDTSVVSLQTSLATPILAF